MYIILYYYYLLIPFHLIIFPFCIFYQTRLQAQAAGVAYSHPLSNLTTRMTYFGPHTVCKVSSFIIFNSFDLPANIGSNFSSESATWSREPQVVRLVDFFSNSFMCCKT